MSVQLCQYHLLRRLFLLHCNVLTLWERFIDFIYVSWFLGFLFCAIDLLVDSILFEYCSFLVSLEFSFLSRFQLAILGLLPLLIDFSIHFLRATK